ncbi:MAG: LysR family transcriptional regulator [Burkholderiales bacterium]|nr:LysR family transcriptional regulator [Burkholderiales bacterium]
MTMLDFSLRSLQVFLVVVDESSFSGAAAQLDISQPSISGHISKLEERIGAPLFLRSRGRRAALTEAGERLVEYARKLLGEAQTLEQQMRAAAGQEDLRLSVSCQRPLMRALMPSVFSSFALDHPSYQLTLSSGTLDEVMAEVRTGRVDVACYLGFTIPKGSQHHVIGQVPFALAVAPDHPLARLRTVTAQDLEEHSFLRVAHRSGFSREMRLMFGAAGIERMRISARATDAGVMKELAMAGLGVMCAVQTTLAADFASGALKEIRLAGAPMRMHAIATLAARSLQRKAAADMLEHITENFSL